MITALDVYKTGHAPQYPEWTEFVYSNLTPRSTKYAQTDYIVVAGLQRFIQEFFVERFEKQFFSLPRKLAVAKFSDVVTSIVGSADEERIGQLHDLGYLPVRVKALPEGTIVKPQTPVLTIVNTKPEFFWLTNFLETLISTETWQTMTSATIAFEYRKILEKYAKKTGTPLDFVPLQGHDFSMRGMSSVDSAVSSGIGHLFSFLGTDTIPAVEACFKHYNPEGIVGLSVPATEHSVMCMGTKEDELGTFNRLLDLYPQGIVSIVSDTWDFWKVITEFSVTLKDKIEARQPITDAEGNVIVPGKTVFRPDSGCPVRILTGYTVFEDFVFDTVDDALAHASYYPQDTYDYEVYKLADGTYVELETHKILQEHEVKGAVEVLCDLHGYTVNEAGYKEMNPSFGLIYGDSITLERAEAIMRRLEKKGFASGNVVLGIGSFTYQFNTRDTYGFAIKATWGQVAGEAREIQKDPKTDDGTKKSLTGLVRVENGEVFDKQSWEQEDKGDLRVIFNNGVAMNAESLDTIRERLWANLEK
jgi:nicotinamide phosphoribosyltransferase